MLEVGQHYRSLNSRRLYRYDGEIDGYHFLTIIEECRGDMPYMVGKSLEFKGEPPFPLIEEEK